MNHPTIKYFSCCLVLLMTIGSLQAQDTLRLTPTQAEQLFLQKNLAIAANKYNVDINKALAMQAGLKDNPSVFLDQNLYDGKLFRHTTDYGQVFLQLQQTIRTAGKRQKLVRLSDDQALTAEAQLNDFIRNLKFIVQNNLNSLRQLQQARGFYKSEIADVRRLSVAMDSVLQAGEVSLKETLRVKALLFELQNNINDNEQQQIAVQGELRSVLQTNPSVIIVAEPLVPLSISSDFDAVKLTDLARQNRPDIALAKSQIAFQQHNLDYQLALKKPDVTLGIEYDRLNSYVPHYVGFSVGLPLMVFNKNQGNIKAAELGIKQAQTQTQSVENQALAEVYTAYQKWQSLQKYRGEIPADLGKKYDDLLSNVNTMYRQRQISLLDFIDFVQSYRDTQLKKIQIETALLNAAAELNFTVGQAVIAY